MRKTGLLSAALLLATSGIALNMHAQAASGTAASPSSTPSAQSTAPGTTTRSESTTTTTTKGSDAQATSPASAGASAATTGQNIQSFTGKITKKDDQFMLEDKDKSATYKLDDAKKADRFDGKNVKVMGTLDSSTNMIHVQSIEEEKNKS